ncbi:MAG: signal peptidase II [Deltaproteobacteria bacterium]|nr:signal peptidase II [Deltaproteobacteria bacterium]
MSKKFWLVFVSTTALAAVADQLSKFIMMRALLPGQPVEVIPGLFDLTLTFNLGAAFGFMANLEDGTRQLVLAATTCLAMAVVVYFIFIEYSHDAVARIALAFIMGGAIGNVVDRVRLGMVIDFLDFHISGYHWPAFNLADSFICCGVVVLLFRRPRSAQERDKAATTAS